MYKKSIVIDAWIREAQEATKLVEDLEARGKNKNLVQQQQQQQQQRVIETAQSKMLEVGVMLDRLESLLYNPPLKPILTDEDMEYRWKMLSDIQQRTRELVLSLYATSSPTRLGQVPAMDAKVTCSKANSYAQDQIKALFSKDDPELLKPLVSNDLSQSQVQIKQCGFISLSLLWKSCWTIGVILGAAALLFILFVLCAVLQSMFPAKV